MCCISTKRAGGRAIIIVEQASLPPRVHRGCSERRLWASQEKMVVRVHEGNQGRRDQDWISRSAQASISGIIITSLRTALMVLRSLFAVQPLVSTLASTCNGRQIHHVKASIAPVAVPGKLVGTQAKNTGMSAHERVYLSAKRQKTPR